MALGLEKRIAQEHDPIAGLEWLGRHRGRGEGVERSKEDQGKPTKHALALAHQGSAARRIFRHRHPAGLSTRRALSHSPRMHDLLALSREIKGIAETGLRYGDSVYDKERYKRLHQIASELLQSQLPDFRWPVELGYPTPKLDARAAVIHEGRILLVKEASNQLWTLPGGWTDAGDTPSENAVRETFEESGYRVEATKLIAIWDKAKHGHPAEPEYAYKVIFACTLLGGEPTPSHETEAIDWFAPDALPEMCPHRASPEYVHLAFRHHARPDLPTEFD
jgi:ADP-ribose pyrophosphatase YjhB (NUDIX family)